MTRLPLLVILVATAAQATLPARDNFHRTDLGGNWSQSNVPAGDCALCSNALTSNVSGSDGLCFWDADAFQGTQYACGRLGGTAMGFAGACVDMDPNSAVCCSTMGNHGWEMDAYLFHTAIGPVNAASSPVFAVGDYIGIQQNSATTFRCYRSTDGTTWNSLGGSDTTVIGGPFPGAAGALSNGQGFTLTQWEGGNGILPSSTPCGSTPLPTTTTTTSTTTTSTTTTSTTSTTTPSSPTTSTTSSSTTTSSTLSTTTTTTSTTTSTTVPAPPLAPSSVIGSASTCTSCAFTWTNATDPFLSQTCIGPSGCSDMSTLSCVLAPATSTTHSQNAGTVVGYFGCSIDTFGQMSTNIGPVFVTTPTCASTSTTTTTTLVPSSVCGDVNNNGRVDIGDALQIGLLANGVVKCSQALKIPGNCDVNHDNHCTIADAAAIQACLIAHNCNTLTCGHFRCPNKDATLAERDNNLGTIWYRGDRLRSGPINFEDLEAYGSGPGTWTYCEDCFPTNPATGPGGPGAHCFRDDTQWNCSNGGGGAPACTPQTCDPNMGDALVAVDGSCNFTCGAIPSGGGGCVGALSKPLEQRALRTVMSQCQDNWLPFCDVRNYGADPNASNATNNAAFAAAVTACCAGGTVYVPRDPNAYTVTQGFNNNEACIFNLVGDGTFESQIRLAAPLGNCTGDPNAVPVTCDALFDLSGGNVTDLTFIGPGTAGSHPGINSAQADALRFPTDVTRVVVDRFTIGINFPQVVRETSVEDCHTGILNPHEVYSSVFLTQNFAHLYWDGFADRFTSIRNSYNGAPYLWYFTSGITTSFVREDTLQNWGNAGIYAPGLPLISYLDWQLVAASPTGPSVPNRLTAQPVVKALHLGKLAGANRIKADSSVFTGPSCEIENVGTTGASMKFVSNTSVTPELATSCTITAGSPGWVTLCDVQEQQCRPLVIQTLPNANLVAPAEHNRVYHLSGGANHLQQIDPAGATCSLNVGQEITLIFDGSVTVDHETGGTACTIALNGGSAFSAVQGNTLMLLHDGTHWREIARSTPPS